MERVVSIDNLRAFCVLWIVAFWHQIGYWPKELHLSANADAVCQIITWSILATFTYVSGYFLGQTQIKSCDDVKLFYIKRAKRFYCLYLLSCVTLFISGLFLFKNGIGQKWFADSTTFFYTILGFSTYTSRPPATLWYFSMLMSFYWLTPLIIHSKNAKYRLSIASFLWIIMIIIYYNGGDIRNMLYFPFYFWGIMRTINLNYSFKKCIIMGVSFVSIIGFQVLFGFCNHPAIIIIESLWGVFLLVKLSVISCSYNSVNRILFKVSYASMSAYLFHRQIYGIIKQFAPNHELTPLFTTVVVVPIIFIVSYYIQFVYDGIVSYCTSKK